MEHAGDHVLSDAQKRAVAQSLVYRLVDFLPQEEPAKSARPLLTTGSFSNPRVLR